MRYAVASLAIVCLIAACSGGQPSTFTLTSASTDPTYWCPGGANNASYELHATVSAHNGTTAAVTIKSMTADLTLTSVGGPWLEKIGEKYDAGAVKFTPDSVGPGRTAKLNAIIPSACTSAKYGGGNSSYGDYRVTLHVVTSSGSYSIAAANLHRILAD